MASALVMTKDCTYRRDLLILNFKIPTSRQVSQMDVRSLPVTNLYMFVLPYSPAVYIPRVSTVKTQVNTLFVYAQAIACA